uniref:Uncharacterized protein n=1 Tax=Ornithorhynchus anatinus TaxID=9258 RepID=A0A6I8P6C7_ORNAN
MGFSLSNCSRLPRSRLSDRSPRAGLCHAVPPLLWHIQEPTGGGLQEDTPNPSRTGLKTELGKMVLASAMCFRLTDAVLKAVYVQNDQLLAGTPPGGYGAQEGAEVSMVPNRYVDGNLSPVILGVEAGQRCLSCGTAEEPVLKLEVGLSVPLPLNNQPSGPPDQLMIFPPAPSPPPPPFPGSGHHGSLSSRGPVQSIHLPAQALWGHLPL